MAPIIVGGQSEPKIGWGPISIYSPTYPNKYKQYFKEEKLEHPLIDGEIKKMVTGLRFYIEAEWELLNELTTDSLGSFIEIFNYLMGAVNREISFWPHSDNDFYANMILDGDLEIPSGVSEKNKQTGHSLTLKLKSRELLNALPFGWISPIGYIDSDSAWSNEENAYDDNTYTQANTTATVANGAWSKYLELTFPSILANNLHFYAPAMSQIDIDIYSGSWVSVYTGAFSTGTWVTKTFTAASITAVRVRFYNSTGSPATCYLKEFDAGIF